jgi:hypothetical protein
MIKDRTWIAYNAAQVEEEEKRRFVELLADLALH